MKKMRIGLLTIFALVLLIGACKKDEKSTTELLVDHQWRITAFTSDPAVDWTGTGVLVTDVFSQFEACEKDDLTIFKSGGVVNFDEGAIKCDPSNPQTETGTWALSADEKTLTVEGDSYEIVTLNENTLKIKYLEDPGPGFPKYTYTVTFTH